MFLERHLWQPALSPVHLSYIIHVSQYSVDNVSPFAALGCCMMNPMAADDGTYLSRTASFAR